ncbi:NAD(P)-dependent oxidoreductase (plasmid) [Nitratireductor sp. L1-7-SE]|uniref:L-threonate dehydrogenase n=1 Tax=Nitratireductor rhodophyticola TaxID=2854036 RepID=A0ABS7RCC5_9HYPH|nr:L-threonate dehydrogenase [Nitratireductor rhodophyticola]MBY8918574.1 NAD(P)-dependent oxidoreductase [Nitratireductor rhodophyticola]MBY8922917.1 NAD(P)-dependent oxidoreductase [Nitratireductor rhodophyticola]
MRVMVVGLGSMGMGAALSLVRAGHEVFGVDPRCEARAELRYAGARETGPRGLDFACRVEAVLILTVNAEQVESVLFGEAGIAGKLPAGTPVMISSTVSADDARRFGTDLEQAGHMMLDAPVSGGPAKAREGAMTVMAAGSEKAFERLAPVLDAVAERVFRISDRIGDGAAVKVIHQLLAGVHIAAGAEAMALATRAGIPLETMYEVVTNAAGNSWMFENRMRHVVDGDYTPRSTVDIFVKDLGLVTDTGRALGFPLPLASTAYTMFASASMAGYGRWDDSAVIKMFPGITLPGKNPEE